MRALPAVGEEISAAGGALLLIVVSPAIVGSILTRHGTEARAEGRWLRGIAAGTTKIAFAITEPDAGTNSHNLSTTATRDGDIYVLKGQKTYISGVEEADAILVVARKREETAAGPAAADVVDADAPGLEKHTSRPPAGRRQAVAALLRRRRGAADRMVGESETAGLKAAFDGLNPERIMGAAVSNGVGRRALELASEYARERKVWGDSRSAPTRASRTRSPRPRSNSSSPG